MREPRDQASEASLIERCRRQDFEAFGQLVDAYQNRVFGFVRRMVVNAEEAADVTQDVFIRAFQNFQRFDGRCSVRTWLFRIAYHLCVDRARKNVRSPQEVALYDPSDGEAVDVADCRWQPEQLVIDDELMGVVESGIASMSEKLRSVLILHDREDMAYEEISQALGVPVGTVKSRLFLARAHLQDVVKRYLEAEA
ncbi:MAG: sigma-70 family RNA polymerase sigma factor [Fimbriimonas sp.]|nr:sigma-70 family RNA polymerase sigma factor [Fimbriimonas sp.]